MKKRLCTGIYSISIILLALMLLQLTSAASTNVTKEDATNCLNESQIILNQMAQEGFNVLRVNDSLKQGQMLYNSQVILYDKKSQYDFSIILPYCTEIKTIRELSISARDEFNALLVFYNASIIPGMNTESIDKILNEIRDEIKNERYEKVKPLIDSGYNEIINVQSSYTALNVFLESTTQSLARFIQRNWKSIIIVLVILTGLFLFYRIEIMKKLVQRQISNLELRKKTIKNLMMKTQKDYFESGKISEGEYNIKIKKFAELVRDIDRQTPLLREELVKLEKKKVRKI